MTTSNFPVALDTTNLPDPAATDLLADIPHNTLHVTVNDAIKAIQSTLGTGWATSVKAQITSLSSSIGTLTSTLSAVAQVPTGTVFAYPGYAAPAGYLMCDGSSVTVSTYSALWAVTGYNFGGSGLNFNLPDLRGKVIVTKSTETEFSSLGLTGGEKTHVLTVPEMPNHAHQVWANSAAGSNATPKDYSGPGTGVGNLYPTTAVGGGAAHNNLQPFIVMNHIIKY